MNDTDQMLLNEYQKVERAIAARASEIAVLKKKISQNPHALTRRPKIYEVEFDFTPGELQPITKAFAVDGGTVFCPATVGTSFRVVGTAQSGQLAQVTMGYGLTLTPGGPPGPGSNRQEMFDFEWTIRDTGADREWQNERQPSVFLCSGHLSPLWLAKAGKIMGGSEVNITIYPVFSRSAASIIFSSLSTYKLVVQMHGTEELS
jgi:hypothetical protein